MMVLAPPVGFEPKANGDVSRNSLFFSYYLLVLEGRERLVLETTDGDYYAFFDW